MVNGTPGWGGYYLSAYGIAIKHGYTGTEEEWLESLRGAGVELQYENGILQWRNIGDEEWNPVIDLGKIVDEFEAEKDRAKTIVDQVEAVAQDVAGATAAATAAAQAAEASAKAADMTEQAAQETKQSLDDTASRIELTAERADSILGRAETVTAEAETARDEAARAAELANSGAIAAYGAVELASVAVQEAQSSREAANTAAETAQEAAQYAQIQGNYAKGQGEWVTGLIDQIRSTEAGGQAADILELQKNKADLVNQKVPDAQLPYTRKPLSSRVRDSSKPNYGLGGGNVEEIPLNLKDYTGTTPFSLTISGKEYDTENIAVSEETATDGTFIIKKLED